MVARLLGYVARSRQPAACRTTAAVKLRSMPGHSFAAWATKRNSMPSQHSMTLTANPPRLVSLYLVIMSRPVSRIVLMTLSSDT